MLSTFRRSSIRISSFSTPESSAPTSNTTPWTSPAGISTSVASISRSSSRKSAVARTGFAAEVLEPGEGLELALPGFVARGR